MKWGLPESKASTMVVIFLPDGNTISFSLLETVGLMLIAEDKIKDEGKTMTEFELNQAILEIIYSEN